MSKLASDESPTKQQETLNESNGNEDSVQFPVEDLQRLDEMLNRTRWIVPVLPKSELEVLLDASINLSRLKLDTRSEHCQKFFRDGLTISFVRIFTDDAASTWKYDIYVTNFLSF